MLNGYSESCPFYADIFVAQFISFFIPGQKNSNVIWFLKIYETIPTRIDTTPTHENLLILGFRSPFCDLKKKKTFPL